MVYLSWRVRCGALIVCALGVVACDQNDQGVYKHQIYSDHIYTNLRVYESPYANVDWANDFRLKAQHHDHVGGRPARVVAYDNAKYDVLSLMDYSGNKQLPYAWTERMWPPERWVAPTVLNRLVNLKIFIPNAEEVGLNQHATSPFLTTFIEGVPEDAKVKEPWQYQSILEMFAIIRANGGFPCIAHPWGFRYENLGGAICAEIYTAYAEAQKYLGRQDFVTWDRNASMLANWDEALEVNQHVIAIAVNDHYGPYAPAGSIPDQIRDSGKIVVLAKDVTPQAYREAFEAGASFAVKDWGAVKDLYPQISSITVDDLSITLETSGDVRWVADGVVVGNERRFTYTDFRPNTRYVRAEIVGTDGSIVYTQAFVVRPLGDTDGDYDVDDDDERRCLAVSDGAETAALATTACSAAAAAVASLRPVR